MFLKSLEMFGFKSFADRVRIDFSEGITALLGPNGCGKSNVVDAVKWVLGEQSVKNMRAEKMDDVIFAGTESRKPLNVAEVILTISNEAGLLSLELDEIQIKRRIFRSGENEYFINGAQVRLKEVRELFFDTGVGKAAYSVMEQGKIDQILSSKPEDRRYLFEEAAQITRAKIRSAEGQRKMQLITANMEKIDFQLSEVAGRCDVLRDQAAKTTRYRKCKEDIFNLELDIYLLRLRGFIRDRDRLESDMNRASEKRDVLRAEIDAMTLKLSENVDSINDLEKQYAVLQQEILQLARTKNDRELQAKHLAARQNEAREKLAHLEGRKAALEERIESFREDIGEKEGELHKKRRGLEDNEKNIASFDENITLAENRITENDKRAASLEKQIGELDRERGNLRRELGNITENIVTELDSRLKDAGYSASRYGAVRERTAVLLGKLKALTAGRQQLFGDFLNAPSPETLSKQNTILFVENMQKAFVEAAHLVGQMEQSLEEYASLTPGFIDEFLSPEGIITRKRAIDKAIQANLQQVADTRENIAEFSAENAALVGKTDEYRATLGELKVHKAQNEAQIQGAEEQIRLLRRELASQESLARENNDEIGVETRRFDDIKEQTVELEGEIASIEYQGRQMTERHEGLGREIAVKSAAVSGSKQSLADKNAEAAKHQAQVEQDSLNLRSTATQIDNVKEVFREAHSRDLMEFEEHMFAIATPVQDIRERLAAEKQALKDLGNVNLMAPEDFTVEEERRVFLAAQKADILAACKDLEQVNAEIQAEASEKF
ncbi:MAG: AAA family ATPase, partial [Spirochaetaceae bacterium]|nr:AAA family ATPase [Spirochaetaceae bacterium]